MMSHSLYYPGQPQQLFLHKIKNLSRTKKQHLSKTHESNDSITQSQMTLNTSIESPQKASRFIPPISNSQQILKLNLQKKKPKPLLLRQQKVDYTAQLTYLNKQYYQLRQGISVKNMFIQYRADNLQDILIINLENVLLQNKKTYWDHETTFRNDLKNTLKTLTKTFVVVLIVSGASQYWLKLLQDQPFDALYQFRFTQNTQIGGIKISKIISDFNFFNFNKVIYLDSLDLQSGFKLQSDMLQYKLPIVNQNANVYLVFLQNQRNDYKLLLEICSAIQQDQKIIITKRQVIIHSIDLQQAFDYYERKEQNYIKRKQFLEQFASRVSKTHIEQESIQEWVDQTRNNLIENLKRVQDKIPLLHYTVGDLLVRNCSIKSQQDQYVCKQDLNQIIRNITYKKYEQKFKVTINCFICFE